MKFRILKDFIVIVKKNKLIDYIKNDTKFMYETGEEVINTKDPKFITLDKMYTGNLIEGIEYQIFSGGLIKQGKIVKPFIMEIESIDQLLDAGFIEENE